MFRESQAMPTLIEVGDDRRGDAGKESINGWRQARKLYERTNSERVKRTCHDLPPSSAREYVGP